MVVRKYKEVVEKVKKQISVQYFCDKCGKELEPPPRPHSSKEHTTIKSVCKIGYGCMDGGRYMYIEAYFCEECGDTVQQALQNCGVSLQKTEVEF